MVCKSAESDSKGIRLLMQIISISFLRNLTWVSFSCFFSDALGKISITVPQGLCKIPTWPHAFIGVANDRNIIRPKNDGQGVLNCVASYMIANHAIGGTRSRENSQRQYRESKKKARAIH